jgi:hypothetical protein
VQQVELLGRELARTPATVTRRRAGSSTISPAEIARASSPGRARRKTARTRAISSLGENGLAT